MVVSNAHEKLDFCTFRFTKLYKSFCRLYNCDALTIMRLYVEYAIETSV